MSLFQQLEKGVPRAALLKAMSYYPPYLGAGVRVVEVLGDADGVVVELGFRPWRRNAVGTQFGGSLYSMCDPWFMLLLQWKLGPDYVVWDKAAAIDFLKPGRGPVRARFEVPATRAAQLRAEAAAQGKLETWFEAEVTAAATPGEAPVVIARVRKLLHVHKRRAA
jgi:acyl-coenzyme A thioesterase PaaI-like protein